MKVSHIEHLGVAVKSLDEAIPYWENVLGLKCYCLLYTSPSPRDS